MAAAQVAREPLNMHQVKQDDGLPLVDPCVLKNKRVMLVRDLDVETVLAGLKPLLQYTHVDTVNAETNRGTKIGKLIDIIQRMSYNQYTLFNAFMKIVAGTQPDLFCQLTARTPSEVESDCCVQKYAENLRECIKCHGHCTDSQLDQRIDLEYEHVQLTIVRDTVDSEQLQSEQSTKAEATANIELSDDLLPSHLCRCADSGENIPAVEVLTNAADGDKPKRVLITGRSGTGKSTTMQWLAREWSFGRWATDFTLVFFLQLRMLSLFDCQMTVIELLMLHSLYTVTEDDLVCVVSSWLKTSGARILIFIDGLDEVSGFTERCQKIFKFTDKAHPIDLCLNIICGNLLPMATVVSASRHFTGLTGTIHFQSHFEIIGLSESQVIEFVQRKHHSKADSIMSVLKESPLIMSICGITFYCALISSLVADGVIFKSEDLQTYTRLISFIIVQHVSRKLTQWPFLIEVSPYFHKLASMAYGGIFGRHLDRKMTKVVFNQFDIVQAQLNSQELSSLQRTGLLQTKTMRVGLSCDTFAEFFHFSIQELLASAYLLAHYPDIQSDLKQLFSVGQFNMAQMYLFGLRYDTGSRWLKEVRFAVDTSGQEVPNIADKYIDELVQELCVQCQKERGFTAKLRLCQLLHEGQMRDKTKAVIKYVAPDGKLMIEYTPLTIIDLMAVRFVCRHVCVISEIHLRGCSINSSVVDFMASSIMKDHEATLHTLNVSHNKLGADGAETIASLLHEDHQIHTLNISDNKIGDDGATAIAGALQKNTTMHTLDVSVNKIGDSGATALAAALQNNRNLQKLAVSVNKIGENGAKALAGALVRNTTIHTLIAGRNNIGDYGATALSAALQKNTTIHTLDVSDNNIGDNGATALAEALQNNTTMHTLNVGRNKIGKNGATALAGALQKNSTIHTLIVGRNHIGKNGATAIATTLQENTAIHALDVCGNNIGKNGAKAIARALQKNTTIHTLDVRSNNIGDDGATAIARALQKNSTIHTLDVRSNNMGDKGATAIAVALQKNGSLQSLDVSFNNIGDAGITALKAVNYKGLGIQSDSQVPSDLISGLLGSFTGDKFLYLDGYV